MTGGEEQRDDLAELLARRALTEDAARADAVERRHAGGGRAARRCRPRLRRHLVRDTFGERKRFRSLRPL